MKKITYEMLKKGWDADVVRLSVDPCSPDGKGTVAQIGERHAENYFFFGGETAEDMTPEEYKKNVPEEDILKEILATLDDFNETEGFEDEYELYYLYLKEVAA